MKISIISKLEQVIAQIDIYTVHVPLSLYIHPSQLLIAFRVVGILWGMKRHFTMAVVSDFLVINNECCFNDYPYIIFGERSTLVSFEMNYHINL